MDRCTPTPDLTQVTWRIVFPSVLLPSAREYVLVGKICRPSPSILKALRVPGKAFAVRGTAPFLILFLVVVASFTHNVIGEKLLTRFYSSFTLVQGQCSSLFTTPFTAIVGFTLSNTVYFDFTWWDHGSSTFAPAPGVIVSLSSSWRMSVYKNTTVLSSDNAWARPFEVFWQARDLRDFPEDYASSLATKIGVPFALTTPPSPGSTITVAQSTSTSAPAAPGLSTAAPQLNTAAKAGIGAGAAMGALLLISVVVLIWRRRWKRRKQASISIPGVPEMSGNSSGLKSFMEGKWRAEVDGDESQIPVEVDSKSVKIIPGPPVELE